MEKVKKSILFDNNKLLVRDYRNCFEAFAEYVEGWVQLQKGRSDCNE